MSHDEDEEIVFKICKSVYGERWYVKRLRRDNAGAYLPSKEFLCKDGLFSSELISHYNQNTNYFTEKQDAIDTINEFYSVIEVIE